MTSEIKLKTKERDALFKEEFSKLKIKVALNWFEIIVLIIVSFLGTLKISLSYIDSIFFSVLVALFIALVVAFIFASFRNYQLRITRFDKEHIYKKISADLIDKSKQKD